MEQTTSEVVAGARLAEDAGTALGEIENVSTSLADLIEGISSASQQQSAAATNITSTMNTIQSITAQTSQGANQTAESIGNLAQLAADLRRSVADFKLPACAPGRRSEEQTYELQSLMRRSYAVFCLNKNKSLNRSYK